IEALRADRPYEVAADPVRLTPAVLAAMPERLGDGVSCEVTVRTPLLVPGVPLDLEFTRTVHMPGG
ncbi:hypothetical protein ACWCOU_39615, partial [Actinomadura luteofluorescens]